MRADVPHDPWRPSATPCLQATARGAMEVARLGEGPAVLALHGGLGGWDQGLILAESLLGRSTPYRVLAPSRPGYLGTPLGAVAGPEAEADLHAALLDHLKVEQALVLAVSAGGPSALAFAEHHSTRCAGLVLVSACTGRLHVPPKVRLRLPVFGAAAGLPGFAALLGWLTARSPERAARASILDGEARCSTLGDPEAGPLLRALQERIFIGMGARLAGTRHDTERLAALAPVSFGKVEVPCLVVHGTADRVVPFAHGARAAQAIEGARLLAIPEGEHVCLFTHLGEIRDAVRAFIHGLAPW